MKALLVLFTVLLFVSGCQKEDSILNSPGSQLNKEFSITGSVDGYLTYPYGASAPFRHMDGNGQSIPGGNVQFIMDYLITSFNAPNGTTGFGCGELITETGDKLYLIDAGGTFSITGTTVTFTATGILAGGTGEYDNIKGTLTTTGTIDQTTGATHAEWTGSFTRERPFWAELVAENVNVTGSCNPGFVRRHAEGSGKAIHFGKSFMWMEHCVNFTTGIITDGTGVLESANGDKMYEVHHGYTLPIPGTNQVAITIFGTINGGEGKFANSSGYYWAKGTQTMPAGAANVVLDGVFNY